MVTSLQSRVWSGPKVCNASVIQLFFRSNIYHLICVWLGDNQRTSRHVFKRDWSHWTLSSSFIDCVLRTHIVNTIGRTYIFSYGINEHALPIIITKSRETLFVLMLHRSFTNVTQSLLCTSIRYELENIKNNLNYAQVFLNSLSKVWSVEVSLIWHHVHDGSQWFSLNQMFLLFWETTIAL